MTSVDDTMLERTLIDLLRERPERASVLDRLGIDFCCRGEQSLSAACAADGVDEDHVAAALAASVDGEEAGAPWSGMRVAVLAGHIVARHHVPMRLELPELPPLAAEAFSLHGAGHPELAEVHGLLERLVPDLLRHIDREEEVAFPIIDLLEAAGEVGEADLDLLSAEIEVLTGDHAGTAEVLERLRELTGGFVVPADASAGLRLLYERLSTLEAATRLHIFKEDSLLFPAAAGLAGAAAARP